MAYATQQSRRNAASQRAVRVNEVTVRGFKGRWNLATGRPAESPVRTTTDDIQHFRNIFMLFSEGTSRLWKSYPCPSLTDVMRLVVCRERDGHLRKRMCHRGTYDVVETETTREQHIFWVAASYLSIGFNSFFWRATAISRLTHDVFTRHWCHGRNAQRKTARLSVSRCGSSLVLWQCAACRGMPNSSKNRFTRSSKT